MCVRSGPAGTHAAVCLRVARPVCVPASTTSAAPCEPACLCANANNDHRQRSFCRRWLLAGRAASVKQFTGVQMNEAFENGHVDGTVQTAAHYQKLYQKTIDDKDAAIAALQEEKLQLVGERDRSEWSYKTLKVELKAEYKTKVKAVKREAAGRIEAMEAERNEVQADLALLLYHSSFQQEDDRDADPWKAWVECEHGIPDDPRQCPSCENTYSTIIRPERLLCGMCYSTEYPRFQAVLEDGLRELEAAEVESEDEGPESPAKRQCLSGMQIHELDSESEG